MRRIASGPNEEYLTNWEATICAFQLEGHVPSFEPANSIISAQAGGAVCMFGFADQARTVLRTYRADDVRGQLTGSRSSACAPFSPGWATPWCGSPWTPGMQQVPEFLFDSVHQSRCRGGACTGRAPLGNAGWCPNLYSGMGATSGLRGGAEVGSALRENPDDLDVTLIA